VEVQARFPAGVIGSTLENLQEAAAGEKYENTTMYPQFAEIARQESFPEIAAIFEAIGKAEIHHEQRYLKLIDNIKGGRVFTREEAVTWRCRNCGYLHEGKEALALCPSCAHPQAHFELFAESY
jgi:rubrerythrin